MVLTTKETLYFWKKARQRAEDDGWEPGTQGYWRAARKYFEEATHDRQLAVDFDAVYRGPRRNPCVTPEPLPARNPGVDGKAYQDFHGVEPQYIEPRRTWVPGELVLLGEGVDVGYRSVDHRSNKGPGPYVHDFGRGVKVYRRARAGERPDKVWSGKFPSDLTVLGKALGFSYRDESGQVKEVKGGTRRLATTPNRRVLVFVGGKGVEYLIEGGNMHVADWIRD
jgi:hypothetical protein